MKPSTKQLLMVLAVGLAAMLSLAAADQNIPNHPAPSADDYVAVGDGTRWVSKPLVDTVGGGTALGYNGSSNSFTSRDAARGASWSTFCPSGVTCNSSSAPYLGGWTPLRDVGTNEIACSATTAGATGNLTVHIYDYVGAADACTCTLTCENFSRTATTTCTCNATLTGGKPFGLYVTGDCVSAPVNPMCTVALY